MTSPVDELFPTQTEAATAASVPSEEAGIYGPDEERLVELARSEALLRLARAL